MREQRSQSSIAHLPPWPEIISWEIELFDKLCQRTAGSCIELGEEGVGDLSWTYPDPLEVVDHLQTNAWEHGPHGLLMEVERSESFIPLEADQEEGIVG